MFVVDSVEVETVQSTRDYRRDLEHEEGTRLGGSWVEERAQRAKNPWCEAPLGVVMVSQELHRIFPGPVGKTAEVGSHREILLVKPLNQQHFARWRLDFGYLAQARRILIWQIAEPTYPPQGSKIYQTSQENRFCAETVTG